MTGRKRHQRGRTIVLVGVVALALCSGLPPAQGAQAAEDSYRIVVLAFPDLAGDGPRAPGCLGCDGRFATADAVRGREDGLAAVQVVLRDADGGELERAVSEPLPNGRQSVTFEVEAKGDYSIEIGAAPEGWALCPGGNLKAALAPEDFDPDTRTARVQFGFWHGCEAAPAAATAAVTEAPVPEAATAASAEAAAPAAATAATTEAAAPAVRPTETTVAVVTEVVTPAAVTAPVSPTTQVEAAVPTEAATQPAAGEAGGSITGMAFFDANHDGVRASDESGGGGVVVTLEGTDMPQTVTTTETGAFRFDNLAPGSYDIAVTAPEGYMLTTTGRYVAIAVSGDQVVGVDFGLVPLQAAAPASEVVSPALPGAGATLTGAGPWLLALAAAAGVLGALGALAERRCRCIYPSCSRKDS